MSIETPYLINPAGRYTIQLFAPSGYPLDMEGTQRAHDRLVQQGHRVLGAEKITRRYQRFAGTDAERLFDINQLADPHYELPDIVLALRGGYGATRLLADIDYVGIKCRLKNKSIALIGYSDVTALQMALLAQSKLTTFAGPMLASHHGEELESPFTEHNFWRLLESPTHTLAWQMSEEVHDVCHHADAHSFSESRSQLFSESRFEFRTQGKLWGGNLAMLMSLLGTPYFPKIKNGILFLEDINEHPYRVERMLYQLHYSGILAQQRALLLGGFTDYRLSDEDNGYDFKAMLQKIKSVIEIPIITELPFGHSRDKVTLPVGGHAELTVEGHHVQLSLSDYPCLSSSS